VPPVLFLRLITAAVLRSQLFLTDQLIELELELDDMLVLLEEEGVLGLQLLQQPGLRYAAQLQASSAVEGLYCKRPIQCLASSEILN
jgi:hypothetical protein